MQQVYCFNCFVFRSLLNYNFTRYPGRKDFKYKIFFNGVVCLTFTSDSYPINFPNILQLLQQQQTPQNDVSLIFKYREIQYALLNVGQGLYVILIRSSNL